MESGGGGSLNRRDKQGRLVPGTAYMRHCRREERFACTPKRLLHAAAVRHNGKNADEAAPADSAAHVPERVYGSMGRHNEGEKWEDHSYCGIRVSA